MYGIGKYFIFLASFVTGMERFSVYWKRLNDECVKIGIDSVFIVTIISLFLGAVMAVQVAYQLVTPVIPKSVIGTLIRDTELLELAPTITSIVLAGKVGSNIAGELGTMRITEQIDALEVMGINSASYLVFPKVLAGLLMFPLLVILSGFLGIAGGYVAGTATSILTPYEYILGVRDQFIEFNVMFMIIKALAFGFLITSISSFRGFYTKGGALEVGRASTKAVTSSCIAILLADYLLAELLLR